MELDNKAIEEFKELYFEEYGIELTKSEARDYANKLVLLVKTVFDDKVPEEFDCAH